MNHQPVMTSGMATRTAIDFPTMLRRSPRIRVISTRGARKYTLSLVRSATPIATATEATSNQPARLNEAVTVNKINNAAIKLARLSLVIEPLTNWNCGMQAQETAAAVQVHGA